MNRCLGFFLYLIF